MQVAYENGNIDAKPNTMVFNTVMNVLSKSKAKKTISPGKALDLFESMKRQDVPRDVYTYTSVMDVLAKSESGKMSDKAEELLQEMTREYQRTKQPALRPNVRTYTSVINAIGRSKERPERANAILKQMDSAGITPDSICYNAVINAWGWSSSKGKELQVYELLQEMIESSHAKPDIITCNSILSCCAYAIVETEKERAQALEVAIKVLKTFTSEQPKYGWPDHYTYGNMLVVVASMMPPSEKRTKLSEALFLKCAEAGHVSSLVVNRFRSAAPNEKVREVLGDAVKTLSDNRFVFNMHQIPDQWKRYAPKVYEKGTSVSRASDKVKTRQFSKEKNTRSKSRRNRNQQVSRAT